QPVSEDKDVVGTEGASVAQDGRGKEPIVSGTTAVIESKKKRADKEKVEEVVKEKEKRKRTDVSESGIVTKKPRTQKNKEPKV
ncbi:hypothetical protein A2U01_0079070, partial [Trifolium medium]|nr:hypothetical protein [Trifolium medium]